MTSSTNHRWFRFRLDRRECAASHAHGAGSKSALLKELFATSGEDIAVSYLRVSIGSSDMNAQVYSYDDLSEGQTDVEMAKFSLGPDRTDVIPILKEILAINPHIRILGSPWSAPAWMKTNQNAKGGP